MTSTGFDSLTLRCSWSISLPLLIVFHPIPSYSILSLSSSTLSYPYPHLLRLIVRTAGRSPRSPLSIEKGMQPMQCPWPSWVTTRRYYQLWHGKPVLLFAFGFASSVLTMPTTRALVARSTQAMAKHQQNSLRNPLSDGTEHSHAFFGNPYAKRKGREVRPWLQTADSAVDPLQL